MEHCSRLTAKPAAAQQRRPAGPPRKGERGFALLLVFLMASIAAITLYLEIPRVAVESERSKEQLLIDRGEQYKRAIQLFTKKAGRYPARIEELESFQNTRFLRKRYIDPMTGKEEWRLVHIQNGILTDSKLTAPQKQGEEKKDNGSFAGIENSFGTATNLTAQGGAALAQRRRASDGSTAGNGPELPPQGGAPIAAMPGGVPNPAQPIEGNPNPANPNPANPVQPGQPNQVQAVPGMMIPGQPQTGVPTAVSPQSGAPPQPGPYYGQNVQQPPGTLPGQGGAQLQGNFPGGRTVPGQTPGAGAGGAGNSAGGGSSFGAVSNSFGSGSATGVPAQPGQVVYPGGAQGQVGQPGRAVNSQTGGVSPYPTTPGANGNPPGINQPGAVANAPAGGATDMINRILTSPRPGGMPTAAQTGGGALGGGIAGIASTAEGESIMVYNDHSKYDEWEFIFDPQKQKQIPNPNATGAGGTPAQQMGTPAGGIPGTPVQPGASPLGATPMGRPNQ